MSRSRIAGLLKHALFAWALLGVCLLLGRALRNLVPLALQPLFAGTLSPLQGLLYGGWALLNLYAEGYRGFQKKFVPRVLGRIVYLTEHPTPLRVLLAPLFAMGYFQAKGRALLSAWLVSSAVVLAVVVVRLLPQPWRGIVDGGVVTGLGYGAGSLLYFAVQTLRGTYVPPDPEVPEPVEVGGPDAESDALNSAV